MASATSKTVTVPIAANIEPLVWQLVTLRTLADEISGALNKAIDALQSSDGSWDAECVEFGCHEPEGPA
jgi:hypothetical protein